MLWVVGEFIMCPNFLYSNMLLRVLSALQITVIVHQTWARVSFEIVLFVLEQKNRESYPVISEF